MKVKEYLYLVAAWLGRHHLFDRCIYLVCGDESFIDDVECRFLKNESESV